jgi:hypothetical protein
MSTQKKQGENISNDKHALVNSIMAALAASPDHQKRQPPSVKQCAAMFGLKFD